MKKTIRLYDFSAGTAALVITAYFCMIGVLAGASAGANNPLPYMLIIAVLIVSFVVIFWHFVGNAIELDEIGIHRGKQTFEKKNVKCTVFYNRRFREMTIQFEDESRRGTTDKRGRPYAFAVQATKQNIAKIEGWLGFQLDVPEKPKRFGK